MIKIIKFGFLQELQWYVKFDIFLASTPQAWITLHICFSLLSSNYRNLKSKYDIRLMTISNLNEKDKMPH